MPDDAVGRFSAPISYVVPASTDVLLRLDD
jgi:hypothetical protein